MTATDLTRRSYERHPYPGVDVRAHAGHVDALPSLRWVLGVGGPGRPEPRRILVAGCGSGAEAFFVRRHFPEAEIVAVDFSPRSIALARRLQRTARPARPIQFKVADLTSPDLGQTVGVGFDLVTCHGVLSYIPDPSVALGNLAGCVGPGGVLYLGVNGAGHPATRLRPWLEGFGIDVQELRDERRLRELLGLWDALHDDSEGLLAPMSSTYLAGDICGPHFNNWALSRWRDVARTVGWDVVGVGIVAPALALLFEEERHRWLYPRGVAALAETLDQARPAGFHRLVLRRSPSPEVASAGVGTADLKWTGLYAVRFRRIPGSSGVVATLRSRVLDLTLDCPLTGTQADALRSWARTGHPPASGLAPWTRSESGRRWLWLWSTAGVVAPA